LVFWVIAGCGRGINSDATANVAVQLTTDGSTPYPVDGMTVSIQNTSGSPVLTGVTGTDGIANITVAESGDYNVLEVDGVDATNLAQGSDIGREFVKSNPIAGPYPNLTHAVSGVTVTGVTDPDTTYPVNVTVPLINKVTVLKLGSSTSDSNGNISVSAGTAAFAGRIMMSNLSFSNATGSIGIWSSNANGNRLVVYEDGTYLSGGSFYVDTPSSDTPIVGTMNYALAGPIYFEAPGTDSGDWALGYNLSSTNLKTRGSANPTVNFLQFYGGASNYVLLVEDTGGGGTTRVYSLDYRIFKFDEY
jgi:hypothetical protein